MSGPHLGARVSTLVDGRLAPDAHARAQEHLRGCCECAEAVDAERLVRDRLASLPAPPLSQDLLTRLLDIGGPAGPLPPRDGAIAQPARPVVGVAPPSRADAVRPGRGAGSSSPPARRRGLRRRPLAAALVGTFSLLGAGLVGAVVLGVGGDAPSPVAELRTRPSVSPQPVPPAATPGSTTAPPAAPAAP
ncbi:anti-sigma factor family protein [Kineococcus terrestris]|uniref:anti-sigma factor family protein n=1 Tax=Kineococcus terrestris TaxID=2044856 RepID=UPI0034DACA12